ncbi:MAG: hypothetical protein JWL64_345 [Frankiales bacterium]|nr:hypothetical protein [Frankiales bacterium]
MTTRRDTITIANCGGFWGDDPTAAKRQVEGGPVDYLVMDYLAEITMAILQKQKAKDPRAGYAQDFFAQMRDTLVTCVEKGITVITNAGGVNAAGCKEAVEALAVELGVRDGVRVAVVAGDDIYADLDTLLAGGNALASMETGRPLADVRDRVLSANIYLGAGAIVKALELGANIVIAGRVTDTSVTLAPMIHEFGWAEDDWDKMASGVVAGHIIECGTQTCGGNFTDWDTVPDFADIGYPLIEAHADGTFVVTKHPGTGGLVSVHTVSEQLLYEMGAPGYLSPDCTARFDSVRLVQEGPDRVRVSGVRGEAPPELLKVAISYESGYRAVGRMLVSGPDTLRKAHKAAEIFWRAAGGKDLYDQALTQFVGHDASHPPLGVEEPSEVLMQVSVRDDDKRKIQQRFAPMVVGTMLQSMPGMIMPGDQGRPRAAEVVGHWATLIPRDLVQAHAVVGDRVEHVSSRVPGTERPVAAPVELPSYDDVAVPIGGEQVTVPLVRLCLGRSGDKGDTANVGVIARSPQIYRWLLDTLTAEVVKQHFKGAVEGEVERHRMPNLLALNFLLHESLGGGGTSSLQFDNQGKTYAQYLLSMPVTVPTALLETAGSTA